MTDSCLVAKILRMQKIEVDQVKCIGCGLCTSIAEKSFKLNDDGKAQPLDLIGDSQEKIQEAIDSCPVSAISWEK